LKNDLRFKSFFKIKRFVLAHTFDIRLSEFSNSRSSKSSQRRNPATSGHWEPTGARIWRHPVAVAGAMVRSQLDLARIQSALAGSGRISCKWPRYSMSFKVYIHTDKIAFNQCVKHLKDSNKDILMPNHLLFNYNLNKNHNGTI
jgi:hypothetical protein